MLAVLHWEGLCDYMIPYKNGNLSEHREGRKGPVDWHPQCPREDWDFVACTAEEHQTPAVLIHVHRRNIKTLFYIGPNAKYNTQKQTNIPK